jgi:predicted GNAT family acetyltransferase
VAEIEVVDNVERHRYEAQVEGDPAFLDYRLEPGAIVLVHTQVPKALEGHGIAQALVKHALDDARRRGLGVVPVCPFVGAWIKRHPEYADLVQPPSR